MRLIGAMIEYLKDQSAVSDLVAARIYNVFASASAQKPYITVQRIDGQPERYMAAQGELVWSRVQINCVADDPRGAALVAAAIYGELGGYSGGTLGSGDVATTVESVTLLDEGDLPTEAEDASEAHGYGQRQDYGVWHRRTVPTFA